MTLLAPTLAAPPAQESTSTKAAPAREGVWVELVTDRNLLVNHRAAWDDLARHALEPNPFMEAFFFLPAMQACGATLNLSFVFIYRANPAGAQLTPICCGFFPLWRRKTYKGMPIFCLQIWQYDLCYLATPLVHREYAREGWKALLDWLAAAPESCPIMEFPLFPGQGPVFQILVDEIRERWLLTFQDYCFTRAFLRVRESGDAYLQAALSGNRRRDYKRKEKRFAEMGKVEYRVLEAESDLAFWIDSFLQIEASGWKGKEGTALACTEQHKAFFQQAATTAFHQGQLQMFGLFVDGKPIAIRCNFLSGDGSFFFRPAYDETHAKNSPGALVELQNIQLLHGQDRAKWMDSCTSPDNTLLNEMWLDRTILQTLVLATGKGWGRLAVSLLPILRWAIRLFKKEARPALP